MKKTICDFEVSYEDGTYVARKPGAPGRVFGRTKKEALRNAASWTWSHHRRDRVALSYEKYTTWSGSRED